MAVYTCLKCMLEKHVSKSLQDLEILTSLQYICLAYKHGSSGVCFRQSICLFE
jgi:hypothetical protein